MPPEYHLDPMQLDCGRIVADREAIRRINPQRFEMEQLTAIILIDKEKNLFAGFKDVGSDEFWVRGHMPNYPLLPGVLMCEAAAQLCSYFICSQHLMPSDFIGFGGMENIRFRAPVKPGDRLLLIGKALKVHRRQSLFNVQGFVGGKLVFHGDVIGVSLRRPGEGEPDEVKES